MKIRNSSTDCMETRLSTYHNMILIATRENNVPFNCFLKVRRNLFVRKFCFIASYIRIHGINYFRINCFRINCWLGHTKSFSNHDILSSILQAYESILCLVNKYIYVNNAIENRKIIGVFTHFKSY